MVVLIFYITTGMFKYIKVVNCTDPEYVNKLNKELLLNTLVLGWERGQSDEFKSLTTLVHINNFNLIQSWPRTALIL